MVQAPFLNLYFSVMGMLEGLSFQQIYEKTRASFHRAVRASGADLFICPRMCGMCGMCGPRVWTTMMAFRGSLMVRHARRHTTADTRCPPLLMAVGALVVSVDAGAAAQLALRTASSAALPCGHRQRWMADHTLSAQSLS